MTITTIVIAILLLILLISTYPALQNVSFLVLMLSIFVAIVAIFSLLIYAYYEMEYIISNDFLLIKWGLKTTRIPIGNVKRVIKPETNKYEGIRLGGVGIPGYLFGKFKYLIEGNFETVNLYATKLEKLLFVETNGQKKKIYGITPAQEDDFIRVLNDISKGVESQVIEKPEPFKTIINSSKDIKFALTLFIISIILSISGLTYFLIIYFQLPQTVPLHFSANLIPNRYGDKVDLLWIFLLFAIFGIVLSSIFYYYIHRRTHLDQTKYGYSVMLIPLVISTVFLILTIILMNMTLTFS
ncbi:MAG: PH domain-containing protein [Promethearchaeota archaeon]